MNHTATYSPEDNKLRLYPAARLDSETYAKVKAAGFIWAPKQELFVTPMWTPVREDLLLEICGEIEDEDKSLVERAEERAERFEDYGEARAKDADQAHKAVSAIADNIPLGQPILVGHHSEKHARKDAERIENGMRKAIKMWEQSKYWESRAKGAIRAAKYKERPDVRARRIKGLEADKRKQEKTKTQAEKFLKAWQDPRALNLVTAKSIANFDWLSFKFTLKEYPRMEHTYEGDMGLWSALEDGIITPEQAKNLAIPCHERMIAYCDRWINHLENRLLYERAMQEESGGTVADRTKPEKGGACRCWVAGGKWIEIQKVNKVSVTVLDNWGNGGKDFTRIITFDQLKGVISKADWEESGKNPFHSAKPRAIYREPEPTKFDELKDILKEGIKIMIAPQLFPTPPEIADKMVRLAEIEPGDRILEPSAGTGNIIAAIGRARIDCKAVAIEINPNLVNQLSARFMVNVEIHCLDFLCCDGDLGSFDRVIMNPPFENGVDIKHIRHALAMLKAGGRLVALCANGPRQQEAFKDLVDHWEDLPEGSFKLEGTNVNVALITIKQPGKEAVV